MTDDADEPDETPPIGPSDADLWRRMRADDADAVRLLFARHGPRIHRYATRRTGDPSSADDITAVVFLEAWRRRASIDLEHHSAAPWLYGVANNVIRHWHRSRRHHASALERLSALPPASPALVERQVQAAADAAQVLEQIRRLPARERDVLVLSVWEGLSHAEVAIALGTTVGTVKSRLSRARARLDPDRSPPPSTPSVLTTATTIPLIAPEPAPATAAPALTTEI